MGKVPLGRLEDIMVLLIVIFIIFIGMGIPHSLLGVSWTAVYGDIGASLSSVSILMIITSSSTVISSLSCERLIKRFGEGKVSFACMLTAAAAVFVTSLAKGFPVFCITCALLGLGSGVIETALNNYVALCYKAKHMNFLHCFYAIGITVSPLVLALSLKDGEWQRGYVIISVVQLAVAGIILLSFPLWKRTAPSAKAIEEPETAKEKPSPLKLLKNPKVIAGLIIIFASNIVEYACGSFGSSYLVTVKELSADVAASVITVYSVGMIVGRFAGSFLSLRISSARILSCSAALLICAGACLALSSQEWMLYASFFLIGFSNGPVCPNIIFLIPGVVEKRAQGAVMGFEIAVGYVGVLLTPILFGVIMNMGMMQIYPLVIAVTCALIPASTLMFIGKKRRGASYE